MKARRGRVLDKDDSDGVDDGEEEVPRQRQKEKETERSEREGEGCRKDGGENRLVVCVRG